MFFNENEFTKPLQFFKKSIVNNSNFQKLSKYYLINSTKYKLKLKQLIAMIELVIACFIGILIGTTTGMIPGIHVNTEHCRSNIVRIFKFSVDNPLTRISLRFDGCYVNSPCTYRICTFNAFGSATGGNRNINTTRTQNGSAGKVQRGHKNSVSRRIWSNHSYNIDDANLCSCTSNNA